MQWDGAEVGLTAATCANVCTSIRLLCSGSVLSALYTHTVFITHAMQVWASRLREDGPCWQPSSAAWDAATDAGKVLVVVALRDAKFLVK